ncbi:glycosyltransferase family 1 protein [Pluteus cervinus]|uniref:Glycosyltransferase family 1 protein n=1 Tax=Pluteus cervinus TaxID=181527 RepID=A0ACD3AQD5_9AGAR|nr:glycosyltransferase family 1 protein [Pluteus cervinus]
MSGKPERKNTFPFHMQDVPDNAIVLPSEADLEADKAVWHADPLAGDANGNPSSKKQSTTTDLQCDPPNYAEYSLNGKGLQSSVQVVPDGRIAVSLNLKQDLPELPENYAKDVREFAVDQKKWRECPKLHIVIMIVGSRGDVQPYVALGKILQSEGHRVRIATHKTFDKFVGDAGLEFFDIGGNPQDLMSYMVKNPGLMPGMESLWNGDISRKREMLQEMIDGCWKACTTPLDPAGELWVVDAIISNPPAFAHVHCAEALGIPLQLSFTMPWSPTISFPHPLVNIRKSNAEPGLTNNLTYTAAELLTWQGTGDIINNLRTRVLGLPPLSIRSGPGIQDRLKVPYTYCMSPALVPKPSDWKNHIDVVGFYFLDLATSYQPPDDLAAFLSAGPPPIYIGFGSVVVDDPVALTNKIFEATEKAGVRALVSAGWGGLGGVEVPPHIFILGNIPHDWLFDQERVAAVVHHGGAGTTAIGLAKGRPTVVVPFFGDQGFWGDMIHRAGAGPAPIPQATLTADNLTDAIKYAISEKAKEAATDLAQRIAHEDGVRGGVDSFYKHLPLLNMRCDLDSSRLAVWWSTKHCLRLSAFAAQVLIDAKELKMQDLELHRTKEYHSKHKVSDPISGGASGIFWTITNYYSSIAQIFTAPAEGVINTTVAIPEGIMKIVTNLHEGFYNAPKLYGSEVREPRKVTDFKSGLREAGKGLFYGYYDAITGLVTEPAQGAQKEGFVGALKGSARSFVNVTVKPAAGMFGLLTLPVQGLWRELKAPVSKEFDRARLVARIAQGHSQVRRSTEAARSEIIKKFNGSKVGLEARRKKYEGAAQAFIAEALEEVKEQENRKTRVTKRENPHSSSHFEERKADLDAAADVVFDAETRLAERISLDDDY